MRGLTACLGALVGVAMMLFAILPASATIRIISDPGGQIGPYLENLKSEASSGEHVVIDGPCLSACTMVLGVIPRDHLCVTSRARLGFHTAWRPDEVTGRPIVSREGTLLLMDYYPRSVRRWIARQGGLSPHMIFLSGRELESMYPACRGESEARN